MLKDWKSWLLVLWVLSFLGLAGCAVVMKDKQSMFVEFGSRIEFGTENSKTHGEESYMKITVDDRLMPVQKPETVEDDG